MRRLIMLICTLTLVVPLALATCSWGWCPGDAAGCQTHWDCNQGGCGSGTLVEDLFMCQRNASNECCECRQITRNCSGSGCQGYVYWRYKREPGNMLCNAVSPPAHGEWCGVGPNGGGGGS